MAIFTLSELFYLIVLTIALGYIFSNFIKKPVTEYSLIKKSFLIDWEDFKFAILITAPAVLLHELAHKFVAILFGYTANFYIWPFGLGLGIFLRVINAPFLILAPGYVLIQGLDNYSITSAIISFAGPFTNLILWFLASQILNRKKRLKRNQAITLYLTKQVNLVLFIFNMLPIPPLDGSKVLFGLINFIFSSF